MIQLHIFVLDFWFLGSRNSQLSFATGVEGHFLLLPQRINSSLHLIPET
uniref:Uncharacterized protein n=1 Tax=Arundo donax TaxID=35708 RepID=A0A0A9C351_ARUDO